MRPAAIILSAACACSCALPAMACDNDIPDGAKARFNESVQARIDKRFDDARAFLQTATADHPNSFCAVYEYAKLLIDEGRFAEADVRLADAIRLVDASSGAYGEIPWNALGYSYLRQGRFDDALAQFTTQKALPYFADLPAAQRMKVFNNAGFAYLQLEQYEFARESLQVAADLGSGLAVQNLAVLDSVVATLEAGDKNIPGVFGVVLYSARDPQAVARQADLLQTRLGADEDVAVFARTDGMMHIVAGSYSSYPRAREILNRAQTTGSAAADDGAFITSVASFDDVTARVWSGAARSD